MVARNLQDGLQDSRGRRRFCPRALAFSFALVLTLMGLAGFVGPRPVQAHALFNDVADSFPATQELGSYGAPISGSELPDGSYKVGARTTSRMCILYTNPADAEARDSKEQAIVSASGGKLTAVFYISKAYTHVYRGTMEEAAASTDKSGTDASSYIAGDPAEGYVPHLFTLPIDALNKPLTLSTYSGGDKGIENGVWYTRQVVFTMTDAELRNIKADAAAAAAAEEKAAKAQEEEAAREAAEAEAEAAREKAEAEAEAEAEAARKAREKSTAGEGGNGSESARETGKAAGESGKESKASKSSKSSKPSKPSKSSKSAGASKSAGKSADNAGGRPQVALSEDNVVTQDSQEEDSAPSSAGEGTQPEPQAAGGSEAGQLRGTRMTVSSNEVVIGSGGGDGGEAGNADDADGTDRPLLTAGQVIAFALVALLGAGALLRGMLYLRALDGAGS